MQCIFSSLFLRDQFSISSDRATVPFLPVHLKDILFAIEGAKAALSDASAIPFENFQIIAKCISGVMLRKKYEFTRDDRLLAYIEVSLHIRVYL